MKELRSNRLRGGKNFREGNGQPARFLPLDYFRIRDFEYVQPLYDLAFLLEIDALANGKEVPKYRTFSLWRAGYSLDGYGTGVDRWLRGEVADGELDYVPSTRIRQYLNNVRATGTLPELRDYRTEHFDRCLRLRSIRGLGPATIALTLAQEFVSEDWYNRALTSSLVGYDRIRDLCDGSNIGPWQTAHIVPPLLRFLQTLQSCHAGTLSLSISGIIDPFEAVSDPITVVTTTSRRSLVTAVDKAIDRESLFYKLPQHQSDDISIKHQMGWSFAIQSCNGGFESKTLLELAHELDPFSAVHPKGLQSDLHLHTAWSDGSASVNTMATAIVASGLKYFAVTDHSRTSKLQGGLTPLLWLRQANALTLAMPVCPVLHGIEVDILKDGSLDLPQALLSVADLVVASVHSNWADDVRTNTDRLLKAIETGSVDILAHPTSRIIGKPGVPDYYRAAADVSWDEVFEKCAKWNVALELNCFPSRLDLPLGLMRNAIKAGCAISLGSDAHARSHLLNLRFGGAALKRLKAPVVLNRFSYAELKQWIANSRNMRRSLAKTVSAHVQTQLEFGSDTSSATGSFKAHIRPPQRIPSGSRVVGIDLTAGDKATGIAILDGDSVETCSLHSDDEIISCIEKVKPAIVSIDSPLGLPGGGDSIKAEHGIVRVAEHDLSSIGIPAYPALIDSMRNLTLRGIRLRREIEHLASHPLVIESYPGAAQDILCIPRKQKSLTLLREGLRRLGLKGPGLETLSHDEMDAITSAIVARYYESGQFEPMGIKSEAELIVPKVSPLVFENNPVICLAGKTGAGKSVVARYLSVFYGFEWVRTRHVIRELLIEDSKKQANRRLFYRPIDPQAITEADLREFGAVILDIHKQIPLRSRLTRTIKQCDKPMVIDSVRDMVDVDPRVVGKRPVVTWFVDCQDSVIQQRLATKKKNGEKRVHSLTPVDRTASVIRQEANDIVSNNGSLEELRWRVDDVLFDSIHISA